MTKRKVKSNEQLQFEKDYTALKHYLIGREHLSALRALGIAEQVHKGFRKDGKTPELHHQINICFTIINLRGVIDEGAALAVALLHDTIEDYDFPLDELKLAVGDSVVEAAWRMDKRNGVDLSTCPVCSIVKGADNCDNTLHMIDVFDLDKMRAYIKRTQSEILPMMKRASKLYPEQQLAYGGLAALLKKQLQLNQDYIDLKHNTDLWTASQQKVRDRNIEALEAKNELIDISILLDKVTAERDKAVKERNELFSSKIGEKARRVIAINELYKEVVLPRPNKESFKTVFEILINKWGLHPSFLTLLDDDKLDVTSALKQIGS